VTEHIPLTTTPLPVRLRVEDFFRLDEAGAFEGYGKTELIRGEIFYMNAQHRPHARAKIALYELLREWIRAFEPGVAALIEATVAMPPYSAPEPDLILTTEPDGQGPVPVASVRLLVEVADTTQGNDLGVKASLYAEYGVPEYWVVDLKARVLHRFSGSGSQGYAEKREFAFDGLVEAATISGLTFRLSGLR